MTRWTQVPALGRDETSLGDRLCRKETNTGTSVPGIEKAVLLPAPPWPLAAGVSNGTPSSAYLLIRLHKKINSLSEKPWRQPQEPVLGCSAPHRGCAAPGNGDVQQQPRSGTVLGGSCPDWRGQSRGRKSTKYHFTLKREELEVGNYRLRVLGCPRTPQAARLSPFAQSRQKRASNGPLGPCGVLEEQESFTISSALAPPRRFHLLPLQKPPCATGGEAAPGKAGARAGGGRPTQAQHMSAKAPSVLHLSLFLSLFFSFTYLQGIRG